MGLTASFWQQHLARFRQQEDSDPLRDRAATGTRDAQAISSASHADTNARTWQRLCSFPSILWHEVYHVPTPSNGGVHFVTLRHRRQMPTTDFQVASLPV